MLYKQAKIIRSCECIITAYFPAHELLVLDAVWDAESVQRTGKWMLLNRPFPAPADERKRLTLVYGEEWVRYTYGPPGECTLQIVMRTPRWPYQLQQVLNWFTRTKPQKDYLYAPPRPSPGPTLSPEAFSKGALDAVNKALEGVT